MSTAAQTIHTNFLATRQADAHQIRKAIGIGVAMATGARHFVDLGDGIQFDIGRGTRRKLIVKLQADDTFAIERVRITRDMDCVSEAFEQGIFANGLADTVLRMGDR